MAGYSGTPLAKKLGIKECFRILAIDAPGNYRQLLAPLPPAVRFVSRANHGTDMVHVFATAKSRLSMTLATCRKNLRPDAMVWVSWPKQSARVPSDITENVVRELVLPLGYVDVKVCAIDETWSGLKLVVRMSLRSERG